jgi:hypothetical protein
MPCQVCGRQHAHSQDTCREMAERAIHTELSKTFERLLETCGDTDTVRLMIAQFSVGYTGAAFGLHIPR